MNKKKSLKIIYRAAGLLTGTLNLFTLAGVAVYYCAHVSITNILDLKAIINHWF